MAPPLKQTYYTPHFFRVCLICLNAKAKITLKRCPSTIRTRDLDDQEEIQPLPPEKRTDIKGTGGSVRFITHQGHNLVLKKIFIVGRNFYKGSLQYYYNWDDIRLKLKHEVDGFQNAYPRLIFYSNILNPEGELNGEKKDDYYITKKPMVIITEKFPGETASITIKSHAQNSIEIIDIALAISIALERIHRIGIVHGDVKSNNVNVYYDEQQKQWIAFWYDFAFSREFGEETSGLFSGSYMAPEIEKPIPANKSQDVYSLGIMFKNCCLTYRNANLFNKNYRKKMQRLNPLIELSKKMCNSNPDQRPSVDVVIQELKSIKESLLLEEAKPESSIPSAIVVPCQ